MSKTPVATLFNKLKEQNIFWSYSKDIQPEDVCESELIETCFRYADWPELCLMFKVFDQEQLMRIWQEKIRPDTRFKKQNLLIARVLFGLDIEADYFEKVSYDRDAKLRRLAG